MVSLLLAGFADETVAFLPFGALEPVRRDLDLTYTQGAALLALYPGVGVVGGVFGVLADRHSRRAIAAGGAFGYAAGLILFAAGGHFATLVVAVTLMGVAGDALIRATDVALVDVAGDRLELAVARGTLLATVGDLMGPALLAACLATGVGWRGAFGVAGAGMAAYGALLAVQPLPGPARHADGRSPGPDGVATGTRLADDVLAVVRDPRTLRLGLLSALVDVFDEPFIAFAIAYLTSSRGHPPSVAILAAGLGLAGGLVAAAWASRADRPPPAPRPVAALLVAGVGAMVAAPHPVVAAGAAACVGAAVNLAWISLETRILGLRPGQAGTTSAVVSAIGQVAVGVTFAAGVLADGGGLGSVMALYVVLALAYAGATTVRRGRV